LLQVISVRADVEIIDYLEGECAVEMDCLTGLGGSSILNEGRRIVYPGPEIVNSPACLHPLHGKKRDGIVRLNIPGIATYIDGRIRGVFAGRCI
jgi:hypothetical protein